MNYQHPLTRRSALKAIGALGAAATLPARAGIAAQVGVPAFSDADIFNFALNLESLETEYYTRGTAGHGMSSADAGPNPGPVNGGHMVPWQNNDLKQFMEEIALNELLHVRLYRRVLGSAAVSRPRIDIAGGFAAAAKAAGLGDNFDPFASEMNFFLGGMLMEDVGVTAYHGAVAALQSRTNQDVAAGILGVEAYHMGMARSTLYRMGTAARNAANAISNARDSLDGPTDLDQGIEVNGHSNFVPRDANAVVFSRTPQQVLNIVYLTPQAGVSRGGIFPDGMNGAIRTT
jgi:hypothetical protein